VGNFRTALYGYLFAKKNNGEFILRIEDTDRERYVEDALEKIITIVNWAGFDYSEGVYLENGKIIQKGTFGPYIQSERLDIYKKYAEQLVKSGKAYYCFCTPERLGEMRQEQLAMKQAPMYDKCCLKLMLQEIEEKIKNGEKYVVRQKINTEGFTEFEDMIRGKVRIENKLLDDQILLKSDGYPTYNFANVVDDHLMEISYIFRGEEYVSSTPKYIQLYENFGWDVPKFVHLPLLLNPDKSKLSKRQGDVAVEDYIKKGYLKEAIVNFVAMLGWNPGEGETKEIFSLEELISKFDFSHVHKAGAVFDVKKLDWLNSQWIKKIDLDDLYERALKFWKQKDFYNNAPEEKKSEKYLKKVLTVERDRLTKLSEVGEYNKFFFQDIKYNKELLRWKDMSDEKVKNSLQASKKTLATLFKELSKLKFSNPVDIETRVAYDISHIRKGLIIFQNQSIFEKGEFFWPLRVALTGEKKSPSPEEVALILGKEESLKRIDLALNLLNEN
jgi:nondiscriminating glutamyl-tRNA synthetase